MGLTPPLKPPTIDMPPPAAHPAVLGTSTGVGLRAQKDRAHSETFTADSTISTSSQGLKTPASTTKATLLGQ